MVFIETSYFTNNIGRYIDDDDLAELQVELAWNPELGRVIRGGGGIRKLLWAVRGRGKRGGARIIYYWAVKRSVVLMLHVYVKSEVGDLNPKQIQALRSVVEREFG